MYHGASMLTDTTAAAHLPVCVQDCQACYIMTCVLHASCSDMQDSPYMHQTGMLHHNMPTNLLFDVFEIQQGLTQLQ